MPFAALVFDLDGTLVDSQALIATTINRVVTGRGHPPADETALHAMVGMPLEDVYLAILPAEAQDELAGCVEDHRVLFHEEMVPLIQPMPGAPDAVATLSRAGWRMAVATNRLTSTACAMLRTCGMAPHFAAICGVDLVERPKPYPDLLLHTLQQLGGIAPADVLMIGDSGADVAMALAAGAQVCAVTWGAQSRANLLELEPTWCVDTWQGLLELLQRAEPAA